MSFRVETLRKAKVMSPEVVGEREPVFQQAGDSQRRAGVVGLAAGPLLPLRSRNGEREVHIASLVLKDLTWR